MRTTIKDIAKKTGLSITTVSLILNDKGGRFPPETRQTVNEAARVMDYRPNQLAISLLTRQTCTIGLIIPDISNVFFSELAKGVEDQCRGSGWTVIFCNSNDEFLLEKQCVRTLADRRVDGVIIVMSAESFGAKNEECLADLRASGVPVILVDCFNDSSDFSTMTIDNAEGSRLAMRHLIGLGHRRIGCITGPQQIGTNRQRLAGCLESLAEERITPDNALVYEGDFRYHGGYEGTLRLLETAGRPTAIFCHNDMMAFGAAHALRDAGLVIPHDISLMGFDDIFFSRFMDVPLSTVVQPIYQMGQEAGKILLEEITGKENAKQRRVYTPRLAIRESTAPPANSVREALIK
jgi:LacI family transcriptional regulator